MMLGPFPILPLLKGWDYKYKTYTRTLNNGQSLEVERVDAIGWFKNLILVTDDCYGGARFAFQGADLALQTFEFHPEFSRSLGAEMQDPSGWTQRYYRPNPYSTAGIYVLGFGGGYQGFAQPYIPTTIVTLFLEDESTEASANVQLQTYRVEVTSVKLFIQSWRRLQKAGVSLKIDPALLAIGPAEFEEEEE